MIGDAEQVEPMAIQEGVQLAKNTRLWPLEIESDAVNVINLINGNIASRAIPRECNIVAHMLAMMASSFENNPQI
ncbi:hypothetical protein WN943_000974 [Citrus x changshan-huyou]